MRAVVLRDGELVVAEVPEPPAPQAGQLLVEVVACGICGSDLHTKSHTEQFLDANRAVGNLAQVFDPETRRRDGPRVLVPRAGDRRRRGGLEPWGRSAPAIRWSPASDGMMRTVGYSNEYPGRLRRADGARRRRLPAPARRRRPRGRAR